MKTNLALLLGFLATTGCATHYARWAITPQPGPKAVMTAETAVRALGYVPDAPPTQDAAAAARAIAASKWWAGRMVVPRSPYAPARSTLSLWVRPRSDGGWDELGVSGERMSWATGGGGGSTPPGGSGWTQIVIHGGSFAANGKERRPSKQVRADVDSVYTVVRHGRADSAGGAHS